MAGQRQPTDLVVMNGRKHLTKAEIEARKNAEVVAPNDKVKPPSYLTPEQKKKFRKIAKELLEIKLIANVDCDALARLLIAQDQYIEITQQIRATPLMEDVPVYETKTNPDTGEKERVQVGARQVVNGERERLMIIQDRCMKQWGWSPVGWYSECNLNICCEFCKKAPPGFYIKKVRLSGRNSSKHIS